MSLYGIARSFAGDYYDILNSTYKKKKKEIAFTTDSGNRFNASKNYPLIHNQEKKECRKARARIFQNQKALEKRLNDAIKELDIKEEEKIQDAFSRKIKSRRWAKRHHDERYTPENEYINSVLQTFIIAFSVNFYGRDKKRQA